MAGDKVCLLCLEIFNPLKGVRYEGYKARLLSPLSGLAKSESTCQDHENLYSRFLTFSNRFLQLQKHSEPLLVGVDKLKNTGECDLTYVFCAECFEIVSAICDLYAELKTVKLHLLWKLASLPEAIRNSEKNVSLKLAKGLVTTLTTQLNAGETCQIVDEFRKKVASKCTQKIKSSVPRIRICVHQEPGPEQTQDPTKQNLVSLSSDHFVESRQTDIKKHKTEGGDARIFPKRCRQPSRKKLELDTLKLEGWEPNNDNIRNGLIKTETGDVELDEQDTFEDDGPLDTFSNHGESDTDWFPPAHVDASGFECNYDDDNLEDADNSTKVIQTDTEVDNEKEIDQDKRKKGRIKKKQPNLVKTDVNCPFPCNTCDKKFQKLSALNSHRVNVHCDKLFYPCPTCGMEFKRINDMKFHERKTHKKVRTPLGPRKRKRKYISKTKTVNGYKCKFCEEVFPSKREMVIHRKLNHKIRATKRECPICFKTIVGEHRFEKHREDHEQDRIKHVKKIFCEACGKSFKLGPFLIAHMSKVHDNSFPCVECNTKHTTAKDLRDHLETHETDEQSFFCTFCFKGFTNQQYCNIHRNIAHNEDHSKFYCDKDKCTEEFKTMEDLNQHLRIHVLDDKQSSLISKKEFGNDKEKNSLDGLHICSHCGWGFFNENNLVFHSLVHTPHSKNSTGYDCPVCDTNVRYMETLFTHYNRVHGSNIKPYRCAICLTSFTSLVWYRVHMKLHSQRNSGEIFICEICNVGCSDLVNLNSHRRKVHGVKKPTEVDPVAVPCEICNEVLTSTFLLRKHMERAHEDGDEKSFFCCFCDQAFCFAQTLKLHEQSSHKLLYDKFECSDVACNEFFPTVNELNEHLKTHEYETKLFAEETNGGNVEMGRESEAISSAGSKIKYCAKCNWGFLDGKSLEFHALSHVASIGNQYTCPSCSVQFDSVARLRHHYVKVHGVCLKQFECLECGKSHFSKANLAIHMKSHTKQDNTNAQPFECIDCGSTHKSAYLLHLHRKRHDPANHVPCSKCGEKFVSKLQLRSHMSKVHGVVVDRYPCPICGITFARAGYIWQHMEVHEQGKHQCNICHKFIKRPADFRKHMQTHNPNRSLDFICSECGMAFVSKSGLKWHMGSKHIPEELFPFKCPHCPKRCHRKELFQLHLKTCSGANSEGGIKSEAPSTSTQAP